MNSIWYMNIASKAKEKTYNKSYKTNRLCVTLTQPKR